MEGNGNNKNSDNCLYEMSDSSYSESEEESTCSQADEPVEILKNFEKNTTIGKRFKTEIDEREKSNIMESIYKANDNIEKLLDDDIIVSQSKASGSERSPSPKKSTSQKNSGSRKRKSPEKDSCEPKKKRGPKKKETNNYDKSDESENENKVQKKQLNKLNKIIKNPNQYYKREEGLYAINTDITHTRHLDNLWNFRIQLLENEYKKNSSKNKERFNKSRNLDFSNGQIFNIHTIISASVFVIYDSSYEEFKSALLQPRDNDQGNVGTDFIKNSIECINNKVLNIYTLGLNIDRRFRYVMLGFIKELLLHVIHIRGAYGLQTHFRLIDFEGPDFKTDHKNIEHMLTSILGVSFDRCTISLQ